MKVVSGPSKEVNVRQYFTLAFRLYYKIIHFYTGALLEFERVGAEILFFPTVT